MCSRRDTTLDSFFFLPPTRARRAPITRRPGAGKREAGSRTRRHSFLAHARPVAACFMAAASIAMSCRVVPGERGFCESRPSRPLAAAGFASGGRANGQPTSDALVTAGVHPLPQVAQCAMRSAARYETPAPPAHAQCRTVPTRLAGCAKQKRPALRGWLLSDILRPSGNVHGPTF